MPEPLPGLMAVLAIDTPTHVGEPMHLPEGLPDVGTAMELALRELPDPDHDSLLLDDDEPTSRVHVLVADDYFGASRVLVLVVLPAAGPGVLPGLEWLAQFAAGEFETQPGPVTPHVSTALPTGRPASSPIRERRASRSSSRAPSGRPSMPSWGTAGTNGWPCGVAG